MIFSPKFDVISSYKSLARLSLIDKLSLANSYACPSLTRAKLIIDLKNLDSFDSGRVLAAVFILAILGGSKPYILRFNLFQTFHEKDYDATVLVDLPSKPALTLLDLFSTTILPFISDVDLSSYALNLKNTVLVNFTVADLSFLRVVETHSIFFKWHDKVSVSFFLDARDRLGLELFLSAARIDFKPRQNSGTDS